MVVTQGYGLIPIIAPFCVILYIVGGGFCIDNTIATMVKKWLSCMVLIALPALLAHIHENVVEYAVSGYCGEKASRVLKISGAVGGEMTSGDETVSFTSQQQSMSVGNFVVFFNEIQINNIGTQCNYTLTIYIEMRYQQQRLIISIGEKYQVFTNLDLVTLAMNITTGNFVIPLPKVFSSTSDKLILVAVTNTCEETWNGRV
ncbi:hypothetical protein GBAR_LOCUS20909, partial [Geodia barretti]